MIRSDGIPFEMGVRDFDHDGQVDVMFAVIDPGIFKIIGMLARGIATRSALLDLNLYRMAGGSYPAEGDANYKIKAYTPRRFREESDAFPVVVVRRRERRRTFRPAGAAWGGRVVRF